VEELLLLNQAPAPLEEADALYTEADKAVRTFFREGRSANTARTYKTALEYWGAWHALRFGSPIEGPVSAQAVVQFIADHLEHQPGLGAPEVSPYVPSTSTTQHSLPAAIDRLLVDRRYKAKPGPWSLATVRTRLAALSRAHDDYIANNSHLHLGPDVNPLRDPRVRQLIATARRAYARRGKNSIRPIAATRSIMEALLATCADDLIGKRDRALLLFGWASGGRRRSEIVAASFENVRLDGDGFVFELHRSNFKPIQGAAANALRIWIQELLSRRITQGALFRRIRHDRIVEPLKDRAVRDIVRHRAELADEPLGKLSAHSLRSGFVTEAGRQGISLEQTMAMTGHRSVQTVMGYFQGADLASSRAAKLFDEESRTNDNPM
jgi:integrase